MSLLFKPADGHTADVIPFFWEGKYHLFYLRDRRQSVVAGSDDPWLRMGTAWAHVVTRDFVHFEERQEAIAPGQHDPYDLNAWTGSVIERDGCFHAFYTGHNPLNADEDAPTEAILHAVSNDLDTWRPHADARPFLPDRASYEKDDWRDPHVIWNEDDERFWMFFAARIRSGPSNRRGCVAAAVSDDLVHWTLRPPIWTPRLYYSLECPDVFRSDGWWYLLFSTFTERHVTHARRSRRLDGPWEAASDDALEGRAFYATKTALGPSRMAFGWIPTRQGDTDDGSWQWGGNLAVHELAIDGARVKASLPATIRHSLRRVVPLKPSPGMGSWNVEQDRFHAEATDGFAWCSLGVAPPTALLSFTATFDQRTRSLGVCFRADDKLETYAQLRVEPQRQRFVFDRWPRAGDEPFVLERPVDGLESGRVKVDLLLSDEVAICYVDETTALSVRLYSPSGRAFGLFVSEGQATFEAVTCTTSVR